MIRKVHINVIFTKDIEVEVPDGCTDEEYRDYIEGTVDEECGELEAMYEGFAYGWETYEEV